VEVVEVVAAEVVDMEGAEEEEGAEVDTAAVVVEEDFMEGRYISSVVML